MKRLTAVVVLMVIALSLTACNSSGAPDFYEVLSPYNAVGHVSTRDVEGIDRGTVYRQIIAKLGATRDVGSGLHVARYVVDGRMNLYVSFASPDDVCTMSGSELLQRAQPIVDEGGTIGIRGVVKNIVQGKDGITMLVEGQLDPDASFDKASITVNMSSKVFRDWVLVTGEFAFSEIATGDTVEVTFAGPVAESYPVQGVAAMVRILPVP